MKNALEKLKREVSVINEVPNLNEEEWEKFANNTTVVLMAGGEGKRFRSVIGEQKVHKTSYRLPNGDSLMEMAIRLYKEAGIKDFVALVYHEAQSIVDLLGNGEHLGVSVRYSVDPEKPVGKGGAMRNALAQGFFPPTKNVIVHNPDDAIVNYKGSFPKDIAKFHIEGIKEGKIATVVVVEETPYPYTGMKIKNNAVTQIEMYPLIPIPTHIGVTILLKY